MNAFTKPELDSLGYGPSDEMYETNRSDNERFLNVVKARMDRRSFFRLSGAGAAVAMMGGGLAACGGGGGGSSTPLLQTVSSVNFASVPKSQADVLSVPTGYAARDIYRTGDPIAAGVSAYTNLGTDDPATYDRRCGDNHDGIEFFPLNDDGSVPTVNDVLALRAGNSRGLLAMNHEYVTQQFLHQNGHTNMAQGSATQRPLNEVQREIRMHGCSIVEVMKQSGGVFNANGTWAVVQNSSYNRRLTPETSMEVSGPVRGNALLVTKFSPTGTMTRGTLNNCGTGYTPWGTFLTCEENWAGYFFRDTTTDNPNRPAKQVTSFTRYGVGGNAAARKGFNNDRYGWGTQASATAGAMAANAVGSTQDLLDRFNANVLAANANLDYRNEPHTYGWIVEIDPYSPSSTPKKRTALGRFAHEAAVANAPIVGQPVAFYMGDDSRGDYIYKFVSTATWTQTDADRQSPGGLSFGDRFLDAGTLYAARFNADGTGTWLPLTFSNPAVSGFATYAFSDQADVLANARLAGDAVGATRMDRPEWGAVNPATREIYFTLTEANNSAGNTGRRADNIDAANPRFYVDARAATTITTAANNSGNTFGHIIRFREANNNAGATTFTWDVYLFGSQADADPARVNLSGLTTDNDFARPDGLWFSQSTGLGWVQTDDSGAFLDQSNCMMLASVPGSVGDGRVLAAQAASGAAVGSTPAGAQLAATRVGRAATSTNLRRFLVGPRDQEITGVVETPDGRTMFVNVQHPGEDTPNANLAGGGAAGDFNSYWPGSSRAPGSAATPGAPRPRSATVVITKNDGGRIGT